MSRIYAIGDIHGRADLLKDLLNQLEFNEKVDLKVDKLIFMGDMIDRYPDSKWVLERIRELVERNPGHVIALAGNHEWMAVDASVLPYGYAEDLWLANGGTATLTSFGMSKNKLPDDWTKWLASLPLYHEEPGFFFSHAPAPDDQMRLPYKKGDESFTKDELTWTFPVDEESARDHGNGTVGVCGHIHALRRGVFEPRFYDHYIYVDSGAGCSPVAPLCAVEVKSRKTVFAYPQS